MVVHEPVAEVINAVVINRQELPRLILQNPGGGIVDGTVFRQDLGERHQPLVLLLIDLRRAWNPGQDGRFRNVTGMHAQCGESIAQTLRMHRTRRKRPWLIRRCTRVRIEIGNRNAVNRLRRMAREPAQNMSLKSALGENIPQRFYFARGARHRTDAAILCVRLHESVNPVLMGTLAGGNRIPQHRGKDRPQSCQISHHTMINEIVQGGHQSLIQQWIDYLPIGRIPADQENFLGEGFRHKTHSIGESSRWGQQSTTDQPAISGG